MSTQVQTVVVGPIETNCYIITNGKNCIVVDPGADAPDIIEAIDGRHVDCIVVTHRHWDHLQGLPEVAEATGAPVYLHELDADAALDPDQNRALSITRIASHVGGACASRVDLRLKDSDMIEAGNLRFKVIHTPGHTIGSMCLYGEDDRILIAGDTLFRGSYGRTDLPTGSDLDIAESLARLSKLPEEVSVYPGHGPMTTIGFERKNNPLMRGLIV